MSAALARVHVGLLVAMLLFTATCSDAGREAMRDLETRASSDGTARIEIPKGALPEGRSVSDIRLTPLPSSELPKDQRGQQVLAAVRLEPDGLRFQKPVKVSIRLESARAEVRQLLLLSSDGSFESIPATSYLFDAQQGTLTVEADIEHFSTLAVDQEAFFEVSLQDPGDRAVGETFDARVVVTRVKTVREGGMYRLLDKPWKLSGRYEFLGQTEPHGFVANPKELRNMTGESLTISQLVKCVEPGMLSVWYGASLDWEEEYLWRDGEGVERRRAQSRHTVVNVSARRECVATKAASAPPLTTGARELTMTIAPSTAALTVGGVRQQTNARFTIALVDVLRPDEQLPAAAIIRGEITTGRNKLGDFEVSKLGDFEVRTGEIRDMTAGTVRPISPSDRRLMDQGRAGAALAGIDVSFPGDPITITITVREVALPAGYRLDAVSQLPFTKTRRT